MWRNRKNGQWIWAKMRKMEVFDEDMCKSHIFSKYWPIIRRWLAENKISWFSVKIEFSFSIFEICPQRKIEFYIFSMNFWYLRFIFVFSDKICTNWSSVIRRFPFSACWNNYFYISVKSVSYFFKFVPHAKIGWCRGIRILFELISEMKENENKLNFGWEEQKLTYEILFRYVRDFLGVLSHYFWTVLFRGFGKLGSLSGFWQAWFIETVISFLVLFVRASVREILSLVVIFVIFMLFMRIMALVIIVVPVIFCVIFRLVIIVRITVVVLVIRMAIVATPMGARFRIILAHY